MMYIELRRDRNQFGMVWRPLRSVLGQISMQRLVLRAKTGQAVAKGLLPYTGTGVGPYRRQSRTEMDFPCFAQCHPISSVLLRFTERTSKGYFLGANEASLMQFVMLMN